MSGCPWTSWCKIGKSARSDSQSIIFFCRAGIVVSVIISSYRSSRRKEALTDDEARMTKPERIPKSEYRTDHHRTQFAYSDFKVCDFFRHLTFVIRISIPL